MNFRSGFLNDGPQRGLGVIDSVVTVERLEFAATCVDSREFQQEVDG